MLESEMSTQLRVSIHPGMAVCQIQIIGYLSIHLHEESEELSTEAETLHFRGLLGSLLPLKCQPPVASQRVTLYPEQLRLQIRAKS